ncbi:MAG: hypothetical protein DLM67_00985 [Candidatus Nephthysia bennettiae]|nr:MAG: hypothetical protein DLM67_00985 [Candidatus Dormibacteraeota bacterium]
MQLRRRETTDILALQMVELEAERTSLQVHLYEVLRHDTGSATEVRKALKEAAEVSMRIDHLREELLRAEARSLSIEEFI